MGTALHLLSLIYLERMAVAFYVEDLFLPSLHFFLLLFGFSPDLCAVRAALVIVKSGCQAECQLCVHFGCKVKAEART